MKQITIILCLITLVSVFTAAVARRPIEIPASKHSASAAIKVAEEQLKPSKDSMLISVSWCRSDKFHSPQWYYPHTWSNSDTEWSWFLTYATRNGISTGYDRVITCRVKENGDVQIFMPPQI